MNYHIMVDDKFIDGFIEDAEKVCEPNSNIYFVRGVKNYSQHVRHPLAQWVDIWSADFGIILNSVTEQDKLFIHWYDLYVSRLILTINKKIPLYVPLWGGDFYEEPFLYHIDWIHDPKTLQFVKRKYVYPKKWSLRPWVFIQQLKDISNYKKKSLPEFEIKKQTISRINYILLHPYNTGEIELTKKIYQINNLQSLPFNYDLNFNLSDFVRRIKKNQELNSTNVLVGNSATESNNHADCFEVLKKFKQNDIRLSVPLSYGSEDYIDFVKKEGIKIFKNKFEPQQDFIPREEYVKKLNEVNIGIMYHNRSQAFGNMITLLSLGKKLYLKKNNPLWQLFQNTGIKVFDANTIKNLSYKEFSTPLTNIEIDNNIKKMSALFSDKKRLEYFSSLLN